MTLQLSAAVTIFCISNGGMHYYLVKTVTPSFQRHKITIIMLYDINNLHTN